MKWLCVALILIAGAVVITIGAYEIGKQVGLPNDYFNDWDSQDL